MVAGSEETQPWCAVEACVRRTMSIIPPASDFLARHNCSEYSRKIREERRLRQCGRDTSLIWSEYPFRVEGTRVDDTVLYTVEDSRMER